MTITPFHGCNKTCVLKELACYLAYQIEEEKYNMVEEDVKLQYMHGRYGCGVYFMATSKNYNNQKDDFPFMLRCCYLSSNYTVEITVLCQNKESDAIRQVFAWVKELR